PARALLLGVPEGPRGRRAAAFRRRRSPAVGERFPPPGVVVARVEESAGAQLRRRAGRRDFQDGVRQRGRVLPSGGLLPGLGSGPRGRDALGVVVDFRHPPGRFMPNADASVERIKLTLDAAWTAPRGSY